MVQVVFRHGARTPLNAIYNFRGVNWTHCRDHYQGVEVELHDENGGAQPPPILDPDTPELPGGCRQGTLTEAGYAMAVDLGTALRHRYVDGPGPTAGFLPDLDSVAAGAEAASSRSWSASVATLRTTPVRRTVATLRGVLTGMWPRLAAATQQQPGVARPVLPVGASLESREIMYGSNNTCPRLGPLHAAMQEDLDAADARNAELPRLRRLVSEALDLDPEQPILWPKLYDHLAAMIADGSPMPAGATQEVLHIVWAQAELHEAGVIGPGTDVCASLGAGGGGGDGDGDGDGAARRRRCREVLRLGIGVLVRRLLDNMEAAAEAEVRLGAVAAASRRRQQQLDPESKLPQQPPSRLFLFSGHDSSVMPLLAVLGQPASAWPPFAANVIFELWQAGPAGGRRTAVGRRGLADAGSGAGSSAAQDPEFWVRIVYDGAPLVVPGISNSGGWAPLALLRQRVMLPYAIGPAEHTEVCSKLDVSDLDRVHSPSRSETAVAGRRTLAARERQRALRHATL